MEKLGISEKDPEVSTDSGRKCPVCGTRYTGGSKCPYCSWTPGKGDLSCPEPPRPRPLA